MRDVSCRARRARAAGALVACVAVFAPLLAAAASEGGGVAEHELTRDLERSGQRQRRRREAAEPGDATHRRQPDSRRRTTEAEPYSRRTGERLRLRGWEKVDFVGTALAYGAASGLSVTVGLDNGDMLMPAIVAGALMGATTASVTLAGGADRGDLPAVLGLMSYAPLTVGLVTAVDPLGLWSRDGGSRRYAAAWLAAGLAGVLAMPAAVAVARHTNGDPGDLQLVRDAGFWGALAGLGAAVAVDPRMDGYLAALLFGLHSGLGLGILAAANTELSLGRVRVITLGGYAGAVAGVAASTLLLAVSDGSYGPRGAAVTSAACVLVGMLIAWGGARGLDVIPEGASLVDEIEPLALRPALLPVRGLDGEARLALGLELAGAAF